MHSNNVSPSRNESIKEVFSNISGKIQGPDQVSNGIRDRKGNIRLDKDWNLKDNLTPDEQELLSRRRVV